VSAASEHARGWSHGICHIVESLGRRGDCACSALRVLGVRIAWHVKRPTSSAVKRMAAARAGIGMRAPGSEQGGEGLTGLCWQFGCTQVQLLGSARAANSVVAVPTSTDPMGILKSTREFKAPGAGKEHTSAVRGGGRDPGVRRPGSGLGRPTARSKFFRAAMRSFVYYLRWIFNRIFNLPITTDLPSSSFFGLAQSSGQPPFALIHLF